MQLAFLRESDPNFPWEIPIRTTKCTNTNTQYSDAVNFAKGYLLRRSTLLQPKEYFIRRHGHRANGTFDKEYFMEMQSTLPPSSTYVYSDAVIEDSILQRNGPGDDRWRKKEKKKSTHKKHSVQSGHWAQGEGWGGMGNVRGEGGLTLTSKPSFLPAWTLPEARRHTRHIHVLLISPRTGTRSSRPSRQPVLSKRLSTPVHRPHHLRTIQIYQLNDRGSRVSIIPVRHDSFP